MKTLNLILIFLFLLVGFLTPVQAMIGVSGDFYAHNYSIPLGGKATGSTIVIYNPGEEPIKVRMHYEVRPKTPFITVHFSESEFELMPKESKNIYLTIEVSNETVPGIYDLTIGGEEIVTLEGNMSKAIPSAALHAPVHVVGDSSFVTVNTVDRYGNMVPCEIRLISLPSEYIINKTYTGVLTAKVAPGNYIAEAYLAGTLLNSTQFSLKPKENLTTTLTVDTVYFTYFDALPAVDKKGRVGYIYIVGVVRNLFKPLPNTTIVLKVMHGNESEEIDVISLYLAKGDTEFKYNYIPLDEGVYNFQLLLYSDGKLYAFTSKKSVEVRR